MQAFQRIFDNKDFFRKLFRDWRSVLQSFYIFLYSFVNLSFSGCKNHPDCDSSILCVLGTLRCGHYAGPVFQHWSYESNRFDAACSLRQNIHSFQSYSVQVCVFILNQNLKDILHCIFIRTHMDYDTTVQITKFTSVLWRLAVMSLVFVHFYIADLYGHK